MRTYKGYKVFNDKEFEEEYGGNWMVTNEKGEYDKVAREMCIIENCKDAKGNISNVPFIAVDNTEGCCWMECYATIDEAVDYLRGEDK